MVGAGEATDEERHGQVASDGLETLSAREKLGDRPRSTLRRAAAMRRDEYAATVSYRIGTLNIRDGDFVGGAKKATDDGVERESNALVVCRLKPLPPEVFVPPPGFAALIERRQRLQLYACRTSVGGLTSIVQALSSYAGDVFEVDPSTDITDLAANDLRAGCALVLDQRSGRPSRYDGFHLRRLESDLERKGSYLAVLQGTADAHAPISGGSISLVEAPDSTQLASRWYRHLVAHATIHDADHDFEAAKDLTPSEAVLYSSLLVDGLSGDDALAHVLAGRHARISADLDRRLGTSTPADGALFVAALVLSGLPESLIIEKSQRLAELLQGSESEDSSPNLFSTTISRRLDRLELVRKEAGHLHLGDARQQQLTISLADRTLTEIYLRTIWREFPIAEHLLRWFDQLVDSGEPQTIAASATALAQLLGVDRSIVGARIMQWARSDIVARNVGAAQAIGVASFATGSDDWLLRQVRAMLGSNVAHERWTVAVALQFGLFERFGDVGFEVLDRLRHDSVLAVREQAALSLGVLLHHSFESDAFLSGQELVSALLAWARGTREPDRQTLIAAAVAVWLDRADHVSFRDATIGKSLGRLIAAMLDVRETRNTGKEAVRLLLKKAASRSPHLTDALREVADSSTRSAGRLNMILRNLVRSSDATTKENAAAILVELWGSS